MIVITVTAVFAVLGLILLTVGLGLMHRADCTPAGRISFRHAQWIYAVGLAVLLLSVATPHLLP